MITVANHGLLEARDCRAVSGWGYSWVSWWRRHVQQLTDWSGEDPYGDQQLDLPCGTIQPPEWMMGESEA